MDTVKSMEALLGERSDALTDHSNYYSAKQQYYGLSRYLLTLEHRFLVNVLVLNLLKMSNFCK